MPGKKPPAGGGGKLSSDLAKMAFSDIRDYSEETILAWCQQLPEVECDTVIMFKNYESQEVDLSDATVIHSSCSSKWGESTHYTPPQPFFQSFLDLDSAYARDSLNIAKQFHVSLIKARDPSDRSVCVLLSAPLLEKVLQWLRGEGEFEKKRFTADVYEFRPNAEGNDGNAHALCMVLRKHTASMVTVMVHDCNGTSQKENIDALANTLGQKFSTHTFAPGSNDWNDPLADVDERTPYFYQQHPAYRALDTGNCSWLNSAMIAKVVGVPFFERVYYAADKLITACNEYTILLPEFVIETLLRNFPKEKTSVDAVMDTPVRYSLADNESADIRWTLKKLPALIDQKRMIQCKKWFDLLLQLQFRSNGVQYTENNFEELYSNLSVDNLLAGLRVEEAERRHDLQASLDSDDESLLSVDESPTAPTKGDSPPSVNRVASPVFSPESDSGNTPGSPGNAQRPGTRETLIMQRLVALTLAHAAAHLLRVIASNGKVGFTPFKSESRDGSWQRLQIPLQTPPRYAVDPDDWTLGRTEGERATILLHLSKQLPNGRIAKLADGSPDYDIINVQVNVFDKVSSLLERIPPRENETPVLVANGKVLDKDKPFTYYMYGTKQKKAAYAVFTKNKPTPEATASSFCDC